MSQARLRYLARLGIPVYVRRRAEAAEAPSAPRGGEAASSGAETAVAAVAAELAASGSSQPSARTATWSELEAQVTACTRCALHASRSRTVFGVGRRNAALMVIGEAPGAEEDRRGEPFVGRAGQLLNAMLRSIGFAREDVYIANILKCRPPANRDPKPEEAGACSDYLARQIELVEPRALLAVGRIAAQWLLQTDSPIGRLRGGLHRFGAQGIPLVVTYHPAYLLRSPMAKAKTWQDLCMAKQAASATADGASERADED